MNENKRDCACGFPAMWARSEHFPIRFEEETGEYQVVHGPPEHRGCFIMRFCFLCGGQLPSRRASLFMDPDPDELNSVRVLLHDAQSSTEVLDRLGPPDNVQDWVDDPTGLFPADSVMNWKRSLLYTRRWKTLDLQVFEMPDGTVTYGTSGKPIRPDASA